MPVVVLFLCRSSSSVLVRATGRGVVPLPFVLVRPRPLCRSWCFPLSLFFVRPRPLCRSWCFPLPFFFVPPRPCYWSWCCSFSVLLRPSSSVLLVVVLFLCRSSSSVLVRATGRGVVPLPFFFVPPRPCYWSWCCSFAFLLRPSSFIVLVVALFLFFSSSSLLPSYRGGRQHICGSFGGRGGGKCLSVAAVFFEAIDLTLNRGY